MQRSSANPPARGPSMSKHVHRAPLQQHAQYCSSAAGRCWLPTDNTLSGPAPDRRRSLLRRLRRQVQHRHGRHRRSDQEADEAVTASEPLDSRRIGEGIATSTPPRSRTSRSSPAQPRRRPGSSRGPRCGCMHSVKRSSSIETNFVPTKIVSGKTKGTRNLASIACKMNPTPSAARSCEQPALRRKSIRTLKVAEVDHVVHMPKCVHLAPGEQEHNRGRSSRQCSPGDRRSACCVPIKQSSYPARCAQASAAPGLKPQAKRLPCTRPSRKTPPTAKGP